MKESLKYLILLIIFLLILILIGGAYYLGTLSCQKASKANPPSLSGQTLSSLPPTSQPNEPLASAQSPLVQTTSPSPQQFLNCNDVQGVLAEVFISQNYEALAVCFASSVRYSRFESSQLENFNPAQAVSQIRSLSAGVGSWTVDQSNQNIQRLKETHPQAWFDAFIVIADNGSALAFNFDRQSLIQSFVYVVNWPAITP